MRDKADHDAHDRGNYGAAPHYRRSTGRIVATRHTADLPRAAAKKLTRAASAMAEAERVGDWHAIDADDDATRLSDR